MEAKIGEKQEQMGSALIARSGELAISASAARAKAEVEAAYIVALQHPRDIDDARVAILAACKRPRFAEAAIYAKPVGKTTIKGPSIRFAEHAVQCMKNIRVSTNTTYEDDLHRNIHISVTDLEQNLSYGKDVTLNKTVERRDCKGREVVAERTNSYGDTVFVVIATEDELQNKTAAAESKIIRNCGLRLIPQDIIEEAMDACSTTMRDGGEDPALARKRLSDAFANLGIKPSDIRAKLGHTIDSCSPAELEELRGVYTAIKEGETTWAAYTGVPKEPQKSTITPDDLKPTPVTEPEPSTGKIGVCEKYWIETIDALQSKYSLTENALKRVAALCEESSINPAIMPDRSKKALEAWVWGSLVPALQNEEWLPEGDIAR